MKNIIHLIALFLPFTALSQAEVSSNEKDSVLLLSPVLIKGYESGRSLLETPAAVGYLSAKDLQRYPNSSLLPSLNSIPGVRMEERSPGSYRLNIRGSLLRSPFGVRNIKVYWNDIPFTDAGGNTYLNLIDPSTVESIEVLKGPGGSLYGANTGGIVVMHTDDMSLLKQQDNAKDHRFRVQLNGGSYGTFGEQAQWKYRSAKFSSSLTQSHLTTDGYRANTRLRKDVVQWNANTWLSKKDKMEWVASYADLYYQTPGGLTLAQMEQDPRQARAIAVTQKAAIYNKTIFSGISNIYEFNHHWSNTTSLSFSHTDFKNPFITNYEKRKENNVSVRSKFVYAASFNDQDIRLVGGAEWIYGDAAIDNYGNKQGVPDTVQAKDKIWVRQWFPFLQMEWQLKKKLLLQIGASTNSNIYWYQRLTGIDNSKKKKKFEEQFLPRLALSYPLSKNISLFASVSKGFSPPTIAEIRSSDVNINTNLQPEFGWNYEAGIRGSSANNRFQFEGSVYYFKLQQAIVRRLDSSGAEYFVNAGGTDQKGVEVRVAYALINDPAATFSLIRLWSGVTYNDYSFTNYMVDNTDHSGNAMTGVPKNTYLAGLDINTSRGFLFIYNHQ
jgi:iron complex outermembrane receptor protein